jgi:hypothetical protein
MPFPPLEGEGAAWTRVNRNRSDQALLLEQQEHLRAHVADEQHCLPL